MKKCALLLLLVALGAFAAWAYDFGVMLDQTLGVGGAGDESDVDYSIALIPYFSSPIGDSGDILVSAGLTAGYENEEGFIVPELLRTEFSWQFNPALRLRAGRLSYADPLNFVIDGLLDGAQVSYNTAVGTFYGGMLYSGLMYKKTTRIMMSMYDFFNYYDDDRYASSRRFLMNAGWQHPALMELIRLNAAFTLQFDVNGEDESYNSQYLTVKASMPFQQFVFELGGALELAQDDGESGAALAGEVGVSWEPPTPFKSLIAFNGRFTTGQQEEDSALFTFVPVTVQDQGSVLKAYIAGLSVLGLDYTARILQSLSAGAAFTYFIQNELEEGSDGKALGGELYGRVTWGPVSDIRVNAGMGVFLPGMGNVAPDADPQWRMELNVVLAIY